MSFQMKLAGLEADEQIIYTLRQQWFAILPVFIGGFFVFAIPTGAYIYLANALPAFLQDQASAAMFYMGASIFFLYAWLFLFQNFLDWYLDVWVVTNKRIINIEQHGLFGRTMSELLLYNVQDVTSDVRGLVHSMFDYGDVFIQTAGERERFDFENVNHPNEVAKRILELANDSRRVVYGEMGHPVGEQTVDQSISR
jgi:uncharacterized membrane protein YdbT with pleckstrin-like domain